MKWRCCDDHPRDAEFPLDDGALKTPNSHPVTNQIRSDTIDFVGLRNENLSASSFHSKYCHTVKNKNIPSPQENTPNA